MASMPGHPVCLSQTLKNSPSTRIEVKQDADSFRMMCLRHIAEDRTLVILKLVCDGSILLFLSRSLCSSLHVSYMTVLIYVPCHSCNYHN